ncbi:Disease resistance protein [Quillaja saponaria]|uniref:Disease resistance protein n=1 Tax=Quillaja saponaria TaxID=32244 RepID=A0AAD7VFB3_QUISA|nr:Disease resistance protein [Quillaja saponaria]KAJ7973524.1 Disease resistance protein [Quillaja saponaria]
MAAEIAVASIEQLVALTGRQLGYLLHYKRNADDLKIELEKLRSVFESVKHQVDAAERTGEKVTASVLRWIDDAARVFEEAEIMFLEIEQQGKSSCSNVGPSRHRYRISRKTSMMVRLVAELREVAKFDLISYRTVPLFTKGATSDDDVLESTRDTMNKVMEALTDARVTVIGVAGMGGVGKTTLVKQVANRAQEYHLFDVVVMVAVSQNPDLKIIQGQIADMLGLVFEEETEMQRAHRLNLRLLKERRVLIILDGIWQSIDLESLGIPTGDEHEGIKILLTSRSSHVLQLMNSQKTFMVRALSEEEAFHLFKEHAGIGIDESDEYSELAAEIVNACEGLPLALVTVGRVLRGRSILEWRKALWEITRPKTSRTAQSVYASLQMTYDYLGNDEKSIFLLCSMLGDQIFYQDLLIYGLGLGIFEDIKTVEEARSRVCMLTDSLKSSSVLLHSETSECATMHDLVRDFARCLASQDHHMFVVQNDDELKDKDKVENCTALSLLSSQIHELPQQLKCPKLWLLHVSDDQNSSLRITDRFFEGILALKVLDLAKMQLTPLASSLHLLTNIQTLRLDHCVLGDITLIGDLKSLKVLSLSHTDIELLPREIGQLTCLCLLDLSNCSKLDVIVPNVLSNLTRLEELYMENSFSQWEVEGVNRERSNASIAELSHLYHLTALEIHIPDAEVLLNELLFSNLVRFKISIGLASQESPKFEVSSILKLNLSRGINDHFWHVIQSLIKRCEELWLGELKGVKTLSLINKEDGLPALKHLYVEDNAEIECIVDSNMQGISSIVFPVLESLVLNNVTNLGELCYGKISVMSFSNLRVVKIDSCHRLEYVFFSSIARGLLQLHEMEISKCSNMGAVVVEGEEDIDEAADVIVFPRLLTLTLNCLPELMGVFSDLNLRTQGPLAEVIGSEEISPVVNLTSGMLFDDKVAPPSLENLRIVKIPKLRKLIIASHASPSLQSLMNLGTLEVKDCNILEEIFHIEGLNIEEEHDGILPFKLRELRLLNLPQLRNIGDMLVQRMLSFKMLEQLTVSNCDNLSYLFSHNVAMGLVQIRAMEVSNCDMLKQVVRSEEPDEGEIDIRVFPLLNSLTLTNLPNLANLGIRFLVSASLEKLAIDGCPKMETFAFSQSENQEETSARNLESTISPFFGKKVLLPTLKELNLRSLVQLKEICNDPSVSLQNLSSLELNGCGNSEHLFSVTVARVLTRLKVLRIISCKLVKEIVTGKPEATAPDTDVIVFPLVNTLIFKNLANFESFCLDGYVVDWSILKSVTVKNCPKITESGLGRVDRPKLKLMDVDAYGQQGESTDDDISIGYLFVLSDSLSNLEHLEFDGSEELRKILHMKLESWSLKKLKTLLAHRCDADLMNAFLSYLVRWWSHNVEQITINECKLLKHAFNLDEIVPAAEGNGRQRFTLLRTVTLCDLPNLTSIWNKNPSGVIGFHMLESVEIRKCASLRNLFSTSVAKNLVQLKVLKIHLGQMTEVVDIETEGEETQEKEIELPQLEDLELVGLSKFVKFHTGSHTIKFPCLKTLRIEHCPKMNSFTAGFLSMPAQTKLDAVTVDYPRMLKLELVSLDNFEEIWQGMVPPVSFSDLEELVVDTCDKLIYVIPSHKEPRLMNLKKLNVKNCSSLKEVVHLHDSDQSPVLSQIQELVLTSLPTLMHVCNPEFSSIRIFENLQILKLNSCGCLRKLVFPSILELVEVEISDCDVLEEIFLEGRGETSEKIVFHHLKSIVLKNLPKLSTLFLTTLEFPFLEELTVDECPGISTFPSGTAAGDNFFTYLVSCEKVKHFCLIHQDSVKNIWNENDKLPLNKSCGLELLIVKKSSKLLKVIPLSLLASLKKLKEITLESCDILPVVFDIGPDEDDVVDDINNEGLLPQLSKLVLNNLPMLENVWSRAPPTRLQVFRNLKSLQIIRCNSLTKLFSLSTAENLQQLALLKLYDCQKIEEVLVDDTRSTEIVTFLKLECLVLKKLPNLVSFCVQKRSFNWPALKMVRVKEIPKMVTFCTGTQTTPMLKSVNVTFTTKFWKGDLNTTIKYLNNKDDVQTPKATAECTGGKTGQKRQRWFGGHSFGKFKDFARICRNSLWGKNI